MNYRLALGVRYNDSLMFMEIPGIKITAKKERCVYNKICLITALGYCGMECIIYYVMQLNDLR